MRAFCAPKETEHDVADTLPQLTLYNTLSRSKEPFEPIDKDNVRMYVCGPTVYDYAHIGNARPVIVFDVLFRLLRHIYGEDKVTYVRNITDVDDKINKRALETHGDAIAAGTMSLNEAIREVTEKTAAQYQSDMKALGCLEPTHQPRATEFVLPREDGKSDMVSMIQTLLDKGHAYIAKGAQGREVLFRVNSMEDYGKLSNRKLEDQQAGARIAVESHKENVGDFVLWKESNANEPGWDGVFDGETIHGRPGWHIECSAMSDAYLGETFDIHGGGLDLIFPHHENEIAQSRCCHGTDKMANVWMHNGFLEVEGEKMSKSLGNFVTVRDEMRGTSQSERRNMVRPPRSGSVMRISMLDTHYRQPINWTTERLNQIEDDLEDWVKMLKRIRPKGFQFNDPQNQIPSNELLNALMDDLNTPLAMSVIRRNQKEARKNEKAFKEFFGNIAFLGLINFDRLDGYLKDVSFDGMVGIKYRDEFANAWALKIGHLNDDHKLIDSIEKQWKADGIALNLTKSLEVTLRKKSADGDFDEIGDLVAKRQKFIEDKNWAEADRIRDELLEQGIQLKDGKDPETGERITTWEVKR